MFPLSDCRADGQIFAIGADGGKESLEPLPFTEPFGKSGSASV